MWSNHQIKSLRKIWRSIVIGLDSGWYVCGTVFRNTRDELCCSLTGTWHFDTGQKSTTGQLRNLTGFAWSFLGWLCEEDHSMLLVTRRIIQGTQWFLRASQVAAVKNLPASAGGRRDMGLILGLGSLIFLPCVSFCTDDQVHLYFLMNFLLFWTVV